MAKWDQMAERNEQTAKVKDGTAKGKSGVAKAKGDTVEVNEYAFISTDNKVKLLRKAMIAAIRSSRDLCDRVHHLLFVSKNITMFSPV